MKSLFKLEKKDYFNISEIKVFIYKTINEMPKIKAEDFINALPRYEYIKLTKINNFGNMLNQYFIELFIKTESFSQNQLRERHKMLINHFILKKIAVNTLNTIYYYISDVLIEKITEKYGNDEYNRYVISSKKLLGSDLHLLSSTFYQKTDGLKNQSRTSLDKDFFHLLSSSVSDKFNNYISGYNNFKNNLKVIKKFLDKNYENQLEVVKKDYEVEKVKNAFNFFNSKIDKIENFFTEIEQGEDNEKEVLNFFNNYSKMFSGINSNSESEMDNIHLNYIIQYIIINGFKCSKSIPVDSDLSSTIDNDFKIKIHEISLLKRIYVLIMNAFEHNSTNISIKTFVDKINKNLYIDVINNGDEIPEEYKRMIFEPFFSIKTYQDYIMKRIDFIEKNSLDNNMSQEHFGYGLNIAKEELNKFNSDVYLLKSDSVETIFQIVIKLQEG